MWLTCSSIGRKFVMAITGVCLVLFVTFHCAMNAVALIWPDAYNSICLFLGANWYALVASVGLAALFILHIIYATWLTIQNRKARGEDRYAVNSRPPQVEWSSKNMYVLGIVVLAFLVVHLIQFWAKMQWQELCHGELAVMPDFAEIDGVPALPQYGTLFLQEAFSQVYTPIVYIVGFVALWFHMNHGFWSMFHTVGWDSNIWIERLKKIGLVWTSVVVALFIAQAIVFTVKANEKEYTTNPVLLEQYAEGLSENVAPVVQEFMGEYQAAYQTCQMVRSDEPLKNLAREQGEKYLRALKPAATVAERLGLENSSQDMQMAAQIVHMLEEYRNEQPAFAPAAEDVEDVEVVEVVEPDAEEPANENNL